MLQAGVLIPHEENLITFVLVDASGTEVAGLGGGFDVFVSKGDDPFAAGAGAMGEKGLGWYWYLTTANETDTIGPISFAVQGLGTSQQNLEYVCGVRVPGSVYANYTVTDDATSLPLQGVEIWFTIDPAGNKVVWYGQTDAFGVARDNDGDLPLLKPGTYYIFRELAGYSFTDPDVEVVA